MRRILFLIHLAVAIGMTVYGIYFGLFTAENDNPLGAIIIAWTNVFMMVMFWVLFGYIRKSENYSLINGLDTSKPFDKEMINIMLEKLISCSVITLTAWTVSLIPMLFITEKAMSGIYLGIDCGAATLVWVPCLIAIAVKYQKAARTVTKD
jgi:hypothetical protein